MRMKPQDADMAQHFSGAFAAIHAQPEKTPALVSHAVVRRAAISIAATSRRDGEVRSRRAVRLVDAVRKVQHGRSWDDVRAGWALVRHGRRGDS